MAILLTVTSDTSLRNGVCVRSIMSRRSTTKTHIRAIRTIQAQYVTDQSHSEFDWLPANLTLWF
jgi:hypothetical protein